MDGLFMYLFTVFTVIFLFPFIQGDNAQTLLSVKTGDPDYVIAHKNCALALNCSVLYNASFGYPRFTWLKNGAPVEDSRRVHVLENGTLFIRRVLHKLKKDVTDQGTYRCIVELSEVGKVIVRDVKVDIAGISKKFTIEPSPVNVPEGGVARFQCEIEAVPAAVYIWEKNKTFLPQNNNRYLVLSSGILQIYGVRLEDAGQYRCYATQGAPSNLSNQDGDGDNSDTGSKYSIEAALVVVKGSPVPEKLIASSESSPVTARVGEPAILECLIQGVPDNVIWSKIKRDVQGSTTADTVPIDRRRVDLYGNNLRFLQTTVADAGTYTCKAGSITTTMQLNVISKPVIVRIDPEGSVVKPKSSWIYVKCFVEGHPKPEIKWLRNGKEIEEGGPLYQINRLTEEREEGSRLALVQSEVSNTGFHQCVATNEAGSASAFTYIEIYMKENAPNQVTNITVLHRTSTTLELAWKPPTNTSVLAYTVNYKNLRDDTKLDHVIIVESTELTDLMPFTNYSIYVVPFSKLGAGPNSEEVTVATLEDVPNRAPSVTLTPRGPSLFVQWADLPVEDARGVITEFTLYVRKQGTANATEIIIKNGTSRSYLVEGLEPHTPYEVRMLAATSVGYPDKKHLQDLNLWAWVSVATTNKDYFPAPTLQIVALNSSTLKASWTVASSLAVRRFTVQLVRLPDTPVHGPVEVQPATSFYLFMGLEMNQLYAVKLTTELVTGTTTQVVEEFTLSDLPEPPVPRNVRVTLRQATSLSVEWELQDTQFEVSKFTVKYSLIGPSREEEDGTDLMVTSNNPSALLDGLLPFSLYQISVRADLQGLQGPFSPPILVQTSEAVPSEPRDIKVMTVQPGQVSVAWQPPAQPNGHISSYTVYYSSMPEKDEWSEVVRNGSQLSAMITFKEQDTQIYYIKIRASTSQGMGPSTPLVPVNTSAVSPTTGASTQDSKTLGIIIGVCIGLFCIAICILILALMRKKFFRMDRRANHGHPPLEPQYIHGNGHIPSNGNGHAHHPGNLEGSFITGDYELDTYTPMLPENEQSDSKGGGTGNVILTPNGAKLNGFLPLKKNGLHNGRHNGHMKSFGNPLYSEETKGLIAEMLSGSPRTSCLPVTMGDERFTRSHCEDSGSLDNIDNSSTEGVLQDAPQEVLCGERAELDSGEGSWSYSSSDRNSTGYINSVPHSDMIDAGESVVFCGDSGVHVPTDGEGLIGLDECDGHFEGHGCYVSGQGDERGHGEVRSYGDGHGSVGNVRHMYSAVIDGRLPEQRTVWNVRGGDAAMSSFKPSVVTDGSGGSSHHVDLKHQADDRFAHTMAGDTAFPVKDIPQSTPTSVTRKDTSNHRDTDFRESRQEANQKSAAPLLVQSDVGMLVRVQAPASRGVDIYQESHSFSPGTTLPQLPQLRVSTSLSPSQVGSHTPESVRGLGPHLTSPTYSVISCNGSIPSSVASHSSQNVRSDGVHESSRRPRLEENHSNLRNGVPLQVKQKNRSVKSSAQGYVQEGMPIESSSGVQQVAPMARISPSFVHGGVSTSESGEGVSSREVTVHCERDTTTLPQETAVGKSGFLPCSTGC